MFSANDTRVLGESLSISNMNLVKLFLIRFLLQVLSSAGRYHFLYFVAVIFFGSFYLIYLILAIVSMSYLKQQKLVEAENVEHERRKTEDDLEIENEEEQTRLRQESIGKNSYSSVSQPIE